MVTLAFSLVLPANGLADPPVCPATITVTENVAPVAAGWKAITADGERALERVSVSLGPIERLGALVPDERKSGKNTSEAVWDVHTGEEFWLVCHYSYSSVMVTRKLDPDIRRCVVSYKYNVMQKYACTK